MCFLLYQAYWKFAKSCFISCFKCVTCPLSFLTAVCVCFVSQVAHFKEFIPQAFVGGDNMILDAEVLLIDTNTSKPLPFGSLGVHKVRAQQPLSSFFILLFPVYMNYIYTFLSLQKTAFQDAKVCLFVFDCIYFNGVSLMER